MAVKGPRHTIPGPCAASESARAKTVFFQVAETVSEAEHGTGAR